VATAGARISHGLNDVEWVANLADERGKGIGAALTWAANAGRTGAARHVDLQRRRPGSV